MNNVIVILFLLCTMVSMGQVVLPYKEGFKYHLQLELVDDEFVWVPHPVKDEGGVVGFIKDKIIVIISFFIGIAGIVDWIGRWKSKQQLQHT